jgi:hypothetical protein
LSRQPGARTSPRHVVGASSGRSVLPPGGLASARRSGRAPNLVLQPGGILVVEERLF